MYIESFRNKREARFSESLGSRITPNKVRDIVIRDPGPIYCSMRTACLNTYSLRSDNSPSGKLGYREISGQKKKSFRSALKFLF